jgi:hypothetical protein
MARRRPGGMKAKRFFDFEGEKIPLAKDEATEIYEELPDGTVNKKPMAVLLGYTGDLQEGKVFVRVKGGERRFYYVVLIEVEIHVHEGLGKYGQVRRRILATEVEGDEDIGAYTTVELAEEEES